MELNSSQRFPLHEYRHKLDQIIVLKNRWTDHKNNNFNRKHPILCFLSASALCQRVLLSAWVRCPHWFQFEALAGLSQYVPILEHWHSHRPQHQRQYDCWSIHACWVCAIGLKVPGWRAFKLSAQTLSKKWQAQSQFQRPHRKICAQIIVTLRSQSRKMEKSVSDKIKYQSI